MIPIRLTLQGIYSYQEKQTIDFTRLTDAGLFGIFGAVGSGKSTILEAITYALYGNTDRLNQKGDNRNYNMMNLKSNELFIEFIFRTGKDNTEYLATVKGRRNSKQFEDVKTLDRNVYQNNNGKWIPFEADSLPDVIGLSYENFKRTVIIPQGRFQEFLQLGTSDRTRMMKELFNLDKFELFYKVVALENKNNQQITTLQGQMITLGDIHPEQITEMEESLKKIKIEIGLKTKEISFQQKEEEKFRNLKDLSEKIARTNQEREKLKPLEPEYALLEKEILEYEYCLLHFKNLLESRKSSSDKIELYEKTIRTDQEVLTRVQEQLKKEEVRFVDLKKNYENRETYNQQAEELNKIGKIQELEFLSQKIQERLTNGEKVVAGTDEKIHQLEVLKKTLTESIRTVREEMPDVALLSAVKNWFVLHNTLQTTQNELKKDEKNMLNELQILEDRRVQLWANYSSEDPNSKDILFFEEQKSAIRKNIDRLNQEIEHLSVQTKLEEYAAGLDEGHECPLCGALTHPNLLNARNVSEALKKVRLQKVREESNLTTLESLQKLFTELDTTRKFKQELLNTNLQKQKDLEVRIAEHQKHYNQCVYREEKSVDEAFEKVNRLQQQLKSHENELETVTRAYENEIKNKDKFKQLLDELRHQLTANTSETGTLTGQLQLLKLNDYTEQTPAEIQKIQEKYLSKYRETGTEYNTANERITTLGKECNTLSGKLDTILHVLEQERILKKELEAKLRDQLEKSAYTSLSEVEAILFKSMKPEAEKDRLKQFRELVLEMENNLSALQKELGDKPYDSAQHQLIRTTLLQMQEDLRLCTLNQGKLAGDLENMKKNFETLKSLIEQKKALELRAEDLKTLKQMFKASGFVNYISSVYLQELCHAANGRFYKLTRQKLSLEVTGDNNFQIRDFMNGGKTRNVKTLSGGQTFQAALSLALALADNIQRITESSQNFFFLDEGFGSLDKESLDVVFDTLKSLRKENRIVGVISHVEEMQQEIDTHLKIENEEERGSLIKASWE